MGRHVHPYLAGPKGARLPTHKIPTQARGGHMPHMVEWYRKIVLSFGIKLGGLPQA